MRGRRFVAATMCGLLFGLCAAAPAAALQPGVFINPGSPAGKEYAFPLSVLRAQGAGKPAPNQNSSEPTFGVGVTAANAGAGTRRQGQGQGPSRAHRRRGSRAGPGGGTSGGGGAPGSTSGGLAGNAAGAPLSAGAQAALARIAAPGSSFGLMILFVAIVLVAGLALGVGWRVLGRRS